MFALEIVVHFERTDSHCTAAVEQWMRRQRPIICEQHRHRRFLILLTRAHRLEVVLRLFWIFQRPQIRVLFLHQFLLLLIWFCLFRTHKFGFRPDAGLRFQLLQELVFVILLCGLGGNLLRLGREWLHSFGAS
jgi:hypothetical protein